MLALDLFCGAGGAAAGLMRAGFRVIGIDIEPQPEYPATFIQGDALRSPVDLRAFDFIWASPPRQAYSFAATGWRHKGRKYPDLVAAIREMLEATSVPFVIENVQGAPLLRGKTIMLCGAMFGLRVIRHRFFECHGFWCCAPPHPPHKGTARDGDYVSVCGSGSLRKDKRSPRPSILREKIAKWAGTTDTVGVWRIAMGIDHIRKKKGLAQAIPPAYAEYIAKQFLRRRGENDIRHNYYRRRPCRIKATP